ncbi:hypothetical protein BDB01DRAFT_381084 [Pilobolus umbonatus]|nr:hypothetical protein BDB01DRAFT_381084 [Pilobolus umbonatus]
MVRNRILVTSESTNSAYNLVKDIFSHSPALSFPTKEVNDRLKETGGAVTGVCIPYPIDTKYYSADVEYWIDEIAPKDQEEVVREYYENRSTLSEAVDAFIFVFEKTKPESFDTLKKWVPFLDAVDPNIRMCVVASSKTPLTDDKDGEIDDWCIAHNFDLVDMDETTDRVMDKVGIDLVVDILQTNLWDGMVKKNGGGPVTDDDLVRVYATIELQELTVNASVPFKEGDTLELPSRDEIETMHSQLFGSIEEEDGLDRAFEAIQSMREHAKTLPDDERRKIAAQVALSFAAQLGL